MATTSYRYEVIPGASLNLAVTVVDANGAAVDLTGATVEASVVSGTYSEAIVPTWDAVNSRWDVTLGAGTTTALAGRQARFRVWVTPAASTETTAIEATVAVKP